MPSSIRSTSTRARTTRSCTPPITASRKPTGTARSSSTTCSGSNSARSARSSRILERTYCQTLGVEFMHISDPAEKAWIQERIEGPDKEITFTREGKRAILNKLIEAEGFEKFLDVALHRHQALRPRRRRVADPGARADHQARRQSRREGDRARHGPSRPPQRADPGDGQAAPGAVPRVQGRLLRARRRRGLGRREVPPRRIVRPRVRRQQRPPVAHRQPVASRDRRSGGARQGARQAGPARLLARQPHGRDAAADPRRRGLRRPGRGGGMPRPLGPARPPHRRLDPLHHQQPDRLHHRSALLALLALSVRRGEDGRGADLPRERRRSGSRGLRRQGRDRIPAEVPEAGRHRHVLLPPLRPQRGRRAGLHPAADVPQDPVASGDRSSSTPRSSSPRASSPRPRSRR